MTLPNEYRVSARSVDEMATIWALSHVNDTLHPGSLRYVEDKKDEFHSWLAENNRQVAEAAWQEAHGEPECDTWTAPGMCREYHHNPYTKKEDA